MQRIWQVTEQIVEDPSTKLRLEFSSVYTDELNAGNEPPDRDHLVVLRLWTSDRTRMASFVFERNGRFVFCEVEPIASPEDPFVHKNEQDEIVSRANTEQEFSDLGFGKSASFGV
jgi:hypothetical protein